MDGWILTLQQQKDLYPWIDFILLPGTKTEILTSSPHINFSLALILLHINVTTNFELLKKCSGLKPTVFPSEMYHSRRFPVFAEQVLCDRN